MPAVAEFRAVELRHVLSQPFPEGAGIDLGCGDGLVMRALLEQVGGRAVIGVDLDAAEIGLAGQLGIYSALLAVQGQAIPLPTGSVDWVFSNSVLEHIDDLDGVLAEVGRLLRPRGTFLFTVPASGFHEALRGPLLPWTDRRRYLDYLDRRIIHLRYWSESDWTARLSRFGMAVEHLSRYMTAAQLRRWETISRISSSVVYGLFRHHRRPVEIQRTLRLRRAPWQLPGGLASALGWTLGLGLSLDAGITGEDPGTCLMVRAHKVSS